jgi:8-oxo-dGTP pyrophosphatase MutT (NUDIX family)
MLLRPVEAEFAPRAQVFPGGRIDEADADPGWSAVIPGADAALPGLDQEPGQPPPRAFFVGAVREVFEEAAVLLGVDAADFPGEAWAEDARRRVHGDDEGMLPLVRDAGLVLRPEIAFFARWVTPLGMPRRYDTRFFATRMPEAQEAVAAPGEIQSLEWITPAAALARADTRDAYTLPPTRAVLEKLSRYTGVAEALRQLTVDGDVTPILPRIVAMPTGDGAEGIQVLMPGDPGYE